MNENPPTLKQGSIKSAIGFTVICFLMFVLIVVLTFAAIRTFPGSDDSRHKLVAEFSGTDSGETPLFLVDDLWEFRWEHDGYLERITWTRSDGKQDMYMEMPGKPIREQGGVNYGDGGQYRFQVDGTGNWTIRIYQF